MTHSPPLFRYRSASLLLLALTLAACSQGPAAPKAGSPTTKSGEATELWTWKADGQTRLNAQGITSGENQISALDWTGANNHYGPVERNMSNGENAAGDGRPITLQGQVYSSGLGVHGDSTVTYNLSGQCSTFVSDIGVDDEVGNNGSVVFKVFGDGILLYDSGTMYGYSAKKTINVSVAGSKELKLFVSNGNNGDSYDHADWANARLQGCSTGASLSSGENQLSALDWSGVGNGYGPVERNRSNGENAAGDGRTITMQGQTYASGLGVHSDSTITYALGGQCSTFVSDIGLDDEVGNNGSVGFQVYGDGALLYDSGVMYGSSAAKTVNVGIAGRRELKLVVNDGGNGTSYDHADWANARLQGCSVGTTTFAPAPINVTFQGPLIITKGGTYSGNFQSTDPYVPVISVRTSEPVIIENSIVKGPSNLITGFGMNLTVRNTKGYGSNPNVPGWHAGRFVNAEEFINLRLENNYFEGTSGIYTRQFNGNSASGHTLKVLRNKSKNIDGRKSNGAGGYQNDFDRVQFIQLNNVRNVPNMEIAWNEIINEPYKSSLEENINFYSSTGTSGSPLRLHNNFIKGAYAMDPATQSGFGGGGIMLGDGDATTLSTAGGYMEVYDNQIVSTSNQGIGIAGGHDQNVYNNRIVSSGLLPDGRRILAQNVGAYVWNTGGSAASGTWFNNSLRDNQIAWTRYNNDGSTWLNNTWFASCTSSCYNNGTVANPATLATEQAEYDRWQAKTSSAGVRVGTNW